MKRREFLLACAAMAVAVVAYALPLPVADASTSGTTQKIGLQCPANYERNSPACKRARAERKCPEMLGGTCLGRKK